MRKKHILFYSLGILSTVCASFFFYNCSQKKQPIQKKKIPDVTIVGPIKMADGIGRQTAELANSLKEDFEVQIVADYIDRTDLPRSVERLLGKPYTEFGRVVVFEESLWYPGAPIERFFGNITQNNQIRIAYSMLESTRIPQEWVMQLNLYFDAVVVPDPFLIEAYRESGVVIPIFELPLGLDLKNFLQAPLKSKAKSPMVFGNFSAGLDRKNHLLLVKAFAKALGNNPGAVLKINMRQGDPEVIEAISDEIQRQGCSNIQFTQIPLKNDAYLKFMQSIDCYVSLSKGEGFSIQPREAMALGMPVIATDNTGQSTICNSGLIRSVKSAILEPAYYFKSKFNSGYRFNCELQDAVDAMKDVYLNYESYLGKAAEARQWASQYCYSNEALAKKYKTLIFPKKVMLGSENKLSEGCLVTDSVELYEKYQKLIEDWTTQKNQRFKNKLKKSKSKSYKSKKA